MPDMTGHDEMSEFLPARPDPGYRHSQLSPENTPGHCDYCGAALDRRYYFCLSCGKPWQSYEAVLPAHRPRQLTGEERVERYAPQVKTLFFTYLAVLLVGAIFSLLVFNEDQAALDLFLSSTLFFITTAIFSARYWTSLKGQLANIGFHHWAAWAGLGLLIPALLINLGYHHLLLPPGIDMMDDYLRQLHESGVTKLALIVAFCVLPALTEEVAFRGLLQHWLHTALKPWHAIFIASALFTALHFTIFSFPILFGIGVLLGWMRWKTGSLYPSMLVHGLHNFVVIGLASSWF